MKKTTNDILNLDKPGGVQILKKYQKKKQEEKKRLKKKKDKNEAL